MSNVSENSRRKGDRRLVALIAVAGCLLAFGCVPSPAAPFLSGVERQRITYTPADWPEPLEAEIYYKRGVSGAPGVLLIHGGSWKANGARWVMAPIAMRLARRGYVVMNATYRGTPHYRYPAPVEDLREAIRWMKANASGYGIDRRRISTFGYSAGGQLAALVALKDGNPERIKAVVAGGAPFDLTLYPGGEVVPEFLGGTQEQVPGKFRDASPVNHVGRQSPPIFIYHGLEDHLVPPEHARRMMAAYEENGVTSELRWLDGRSHVTAFVFSRSAVDAAIDFLDRVSIR